MTGQVSSGTWRTWTAMVAALLIIGLAPPGEAYVRPGKTRMVSVSSDGVAGVPHPLDDNDATGQQSSISADGRYVAFTSSASNLVVPDANPGFDVLMKDMKTGKIEFVDVSSEGTQAVTRPPPGDGEFTGQSVSAKGRYVAFVSSAANLVPGDTNICTTYDSSVPRPCPDIFVRDRYAGTTTRISVSSSGAEANGASIGPSISADGRYVAFSSAASNLVDGDTNEDFDVFVHDTRTHKTTRASVSSKEEQADGGTGRQGLDISANGRYIAFASAAANLIPDDNNFYPDIFVRDLTAGTTELVSKASDGAHNTGFAEFPVISGNGRHVAFLAGGFPAGGTNLVPDDSNNFMGVLSIPDAFVHDRQTARTERVSVSSWGGQANGYTAVRLAISDNGRYVAFGSLASNLVPGGEEEPFTPAVVGSEDMDVFVYDRVTGAPTYVSLDASGNPYCCDPGTYPSDYPSLSATGRYIAFRSYYRLTGPPAPPGVQFYLRDQGSALRVGELGGDGGGDDEPRDDQICITPDVCIPPGGAVATIDGWSDVSSFLSAQGANLYGASLAYRPQYEDLFARIELQDMPSLNVGAAGVSAAGSPTILYGLRFQVGSKRFEVRAMSLLGGTFGLFDCTTTRPPCTKIADFRGGYGTTGMRVVFSLPLEEIGLENGGRISNVVAFSGLGAYPTGATKILDQVRIKKQIPQS